MASIADFQSGESADLFNDAFTNAGYGADLNLETPFPLAETEAPVFSAPLGWAAMKSSETASTMPAFPRMKNMEYASFPYVLRKIRILFCSGPVSVLGGTQT